MGSIGLFRNLVRLPDGTVVLRAAGENGYIWLAALMGLAFVAAGVAAAPARLFVFGGALLVAGAALLARWRAHRGLYATDGGVAWVDGPRRLDIAPRAGVSLLSVARRGTLRDNDLYIEFRDGEGGVLGQMKNGFEGRYGTSRWNRAELEAFARALGWAFEYDGGTSRLTKAAPRAGGPEDA